MKGRSMSRSDDLSRLLAAERGAAPPAGAAEAGLNRLLSSLAAHAAPLPVAVGSLHLGWSVVGKCLGVGFVVGMGGAGAAVYVSSATDGSNVAAAPVAIVSSVAPSAALQPQVLLEPRVVPVVSAVTPGASKELPRTDAAPPGALTASATSSASASSSRGFDEELRLIASAKRELDAGRAQAALALLAEHRQRFSAGVFGLERDGLSALASCTGKPSPEVARAFASAHPSSPLLKQIQRRCGSASESSRVGTTPPTDSPEIPQ